MKKFWGVFFIFFLGMNLYGKIKVVPLQSPILEESFQTYVVVKALEKLGYKVEPIKEVAYQVAFQTISQNAKSDDIYFMAVNWDPIQVNMYDGLGGDKNFYRKGIFVESCAAGYVIDKKTADKYNIKYISDLKDPKIAKLFDIDGDGKADLTGANPGWALVNVIEHHIDAYGLRDRVEQKKGEYSAMIANTIARYKKGKPVLYYTWTPYWVSGKLVPGRDVTWLQVPFSAHPTTKSTKLSNGMDFGFNINNQRIVANKNVEIKYPDVAKLFSLMKISVNDISAENMLISNGQNKDEDIKRHADIWIKKNLDLFNSWIEESKKAKK